MDFVCVSVDTAFTEKEENDPTGCTTWGVWTDEKDGHPRMLAARISERDSVTEQNVTLVTLDVTLWRSGQRDGRDTSRRLVTSVTPRVPLYVRIAGGEKRGRCHGAPSCRARNTSWTPSISLTMSVLWPWRA
jgi:hypothetical protein